MSEAQFYTFLNRIVQNKAIDRLHRRCLSMSPTDELEEQGNPNDDTDPLNAVIEPLWGDVPFA